jgi:bifunctional non-homologous end joining protein LigD
MGLALYKKKRSFDKTTEPTGGKAAGKQLRFVVQKHDASHLHYDFRLEMEGVLKSWAVPKGPSMDPSVKRLAMMVEDHPYDYRNFEGIIPEGNYGAGTVIVWDEGTYEPAETSDESKLSQEKQLLSELKKKRLKFTLHGKKLKGNFALVKSGYGQENAWLLMKLDDKYASTADITEKDKSVVSKKTVEQVAKANGKTVVKKVAPKKTAQRAATKKTAVKTVKKNETPEIKELLRKASTAAFPKPFKPMLATRVTEAFDGEDWVYEIKWDGYRAMAYLNGSKAELYSRNLLSFDKKFAPVLDALKQLNLKAVVDGEVVALDENDQPSFQLLQNHEAKDTRFAFCVFDIVWYNGKDLTELGLLERKSILRAILPQDDAVIRYSDHVAGQGKQFFAAAVEHGLEGVMAKQINSRYLKAYRSSEWLKIKNEQRLEAIICGFTKPRNSRSYFGAVILGKYFGSTLKYIGHSGSGFNEKTLKQLYSMFKPLLTDKCPFKTVPKTNMPVTWLRPELVCEVKYTEFTGEKILRHPIFLGLREDKKAVNEKNEKVVKAPVLKKKAVKKTTLKKTATKKAKTPAKKTANKTQEFFQNGDKRIDPRRR